MKEKDVREMMTELFERHSVPSIPVKFFSKPITTKLDISKKLEDAGLSQFADTVTATTTTYGAFMINSVTRERWIEFYGLPSPTDVRHEFKHYLDHLGVKYIRKSPTKSKEAEG
ncbi:unnamed protein product [marine sediment metagenome]|uniref:Uncharacterized protein n=1 Tax=marine sediment metagenome TaxID=412755 RepID=X1I656_9ZZZZ